MMFVREMHLTMGRKRKHEGIKYDRKPPLKKGDRVGLDGEVMDADCGRDAHGHKLVLVQWSCGPECKDCHGEPQPVRADHLQARFSTKRTVSCGKHKRKLRHEYMCQQTAHAEADKVKGMDSITGKPIPQSAVKKKRRHND